jgi:hypothetical protein
MTILLTVFLLSVAESLSLFCITSDVWSKKGLSTCYIVVTVHFISRLGKLIRCVLAMPEFPPPHTAIAITTITKSVIEEWGLGGKVAFAVTDNAAAMIAAFKETLWRAVGAVEDDEDEEELESIHRDSQDETRNLETVAIDLERADPSEQEIDLNIQTAEIEEESLNLEFRRRGGFGQSRERRMKRLSCLSHTLQLVMAGFEKFVTARGTQPQFMAVIRKARALISSFNMSTIATSRLIKKAGKKLIKDVSTRWSSTYLMLLRLFELKKAISEVCEELEWDSLVASEWEKLRNVLNLLEQFAKYTQLATSATIPTFSSIIPIVQELHLHLMEVLDLTSKVEILKKALPIIYY